MSKFHDERPIELGEVPDEEGITPHDAEERADLDPEEQPNRFDPVQGTRAPDPDEV